MQLITFLISTFYKAKAQITKSAPLKRKAKTILLILSKADKTALIVFIKLMSYFEALIFDIRNCRFRGLV
jgi:hypothetical protein